MKKFNLRNLLCLALMMLSIAVTAQEVRTFQFNHEGKAGFKMTEQTRGNVTLDYSINEMSLTSFTYDGEEMHAIGIADISLPNAKGLPNVPTYSRAIAIPQGAQAVLHVKSYEQQVISNVNVEPSLGVQAESEEPDMNYTKDMKVYAENAYYPADFARMSAPSQFRGVDIVNVSISPVRFNPVTKEAIVYHNIEVEVEFVGGNGQFGDNRLRSPYFDPILEQNIINYSSLPVIDYEARMQQWLRDGAEGAEYIIVIPNNDGFVEPAQRLRDYRMQQGILTEVIKLEDMPATSTNELKTWFHNAYNTWDIAPVAVLLFGDHNTNMAQGIPAITVSHPASSTCITDNQYADVDNNLLPDMVFSRLVAADATEAVMMADKQIEYEYTNPNMDPSFYTSPITALGWQTERWFQLCSEVFGGYMRAHGYTPQRINCIYSGTPGSSWSSNQNTGDVVDYFGPNGTNYIPASPEDLGGWTGGSPEQVVAAVNNGAFWLQHRDHGYNEGWGEPSVSNSHIDQMTNVGKMPFVMSINCQTGMFNYTGSNGNCFAEKWMRRTYNGQNAGAVGILCPTEISYSFVNDAFVWGVYDQFDPDFMPTLPNNTNTPAYAYRGNWRPAFGNVAGKYFLYETSWPYNDDDKDITYIMFTAHCDAFLRIYTQVPQTMTVQHQSVQLAGLSELQITAPEGATIALTKGTGENLEIVAVATATGSVQNVTIAPQVPPTVLHLTVTAQNYLRYESDIEVIPAAGPYIIINEYSLSNGEQQLNFGEEYGFDLQFKNVGSTTAPAGTATLTSESEYVTIINGTADLADINSNETLNVNEAFTFVISDDIPNKTNIEFVVTITSGDDIYENHITMKAYAPVFNIGSVTITEIEGNGNGRLDPGEVASLSFPIENKGNADSWTTYATLAINNDYMEVISDPTVTLDGIAANGTANAVFTIYVGAAPSGFAANYTLDVMSGAYTDTRDFVTKIGLNVEDFELNVIDPDLFTNDATHPWTICDEDPYEGIYCVKSGAIGNSQETLLTLSYEVVETDTIAFYYKVSSENNYDKLYFYIDNNEMNDWSGSVAWSFVQYRVNPGRHTFTWKYKKDGSVASGQDCAWIDYVILPKDRDLTVSAGTDIETCPDNVQLNGVVLNQTSMEWTTSGDGTFSDATITNPIYTPGEQDIANGSVTLTLTGYNGEVSKSDSITATFLPETTIELVESLLPATACMGVIDINYYYVAENADDVIFTSAGDGLFVAGIYNFGVNDILNGGADITITAIGCGEASVSLHVAYSGIPLVEGTDAISTCLHEPVEATIAFTTDWGEFVGWTTLGTGVIDDPESMTIHYTPSDSDFTLGGIVLVAEYADCIGDSYFHNVTVELISVPTLLMPVGPIEITSQDTVSSYMVVGNEMFVDYTWTLEPADAGVLTADGNRVTITWNKNHPNTDALLSVVGHTDGCGDSEPSMPLVIALTGYGINEIGESAINIHPNPTNDIINVSIENLTAKVQITLYNSVGQVVYTKDESTENGLNTTIDLSSFANGAYILQIRSNEGVWMKRVVKK